MEETIFLIGNVVVAKTLRQGSTPGPSKIGANLHTISLTFSGLDVSVSFSLVECPNGFLSDRSCVLCKYVRQPVLTFEDSHGHEHIPSLSGILPELKLTNENLDEHMCGQPSKEDDSSRSAWHDRHGVGALFASPEILSIS